MQSGLPPAAHLVRCVDVHLCAASQLEIVVAGRATRVLGEQTAAVDPTRLGARVGRLTSAEMQQVDAALRIVMAI